jgi:hypothetical protein
MLVEHPMLGPAKLQSCPFPLAAATHKGMLRLYYTVQYYVLYCFRVTWHGPIVRAARVTVPRYRIMDSGSTKTGSDELKSVFETHLAEAGQMPFGCEEGDVSKGQVPKSTFQYRIVTE